MPTWPSAVEEDEVAGLQLVARDRDAHRVERVGRVRQRDADLGVGPHDEAGAVEAAGRGAAPDVRRAELDDARPRRRRRASTAARRRWTPPGRRRVMPTTVSDACCCWDAVSCDDPRLHRCAICSWRRRSAAIMRRDLALDRVESGLLLRELRDSIDRLAAARSATTRCWSRRSPLPAAARFRCTARAERLDLAEDVRVEGRDAAARCRAG